LVSRNSASISKVVQKTLTCHAVQKKATKEQTLATIISVTQCLYQQ